MNADYCLGRVRTGRTTKIYVVDPPRRPIGRGLTVGHSGGGQIAASPPTAVLVDKAHDADRTREMLQDQGVRSPPSGQHSAPEAVLQQGSQPRA
ncbi:hypothetical protein CA233_21975 [Sphingomonas sp. ABOLD]|uniref:hypothetical protein n=1 Tax=Sphingomonas TaxID=13687 RepID=UPI000F7EAD92|nr:MULTISPECIES: hypothetical protein [Sphingomonas]RSV37443.1 hypothetical protein CA233_21975 [Sphingomonas sp. ABOLD]